MTGLLEVFLDQPKTECNRIHLFSRGNYGGFHHDGVQGFLEEMDSVGGSDQFQPAVLDAFLLILLRV